MGWLSGNTQRIWGSVCATASAAIFSVAERPRNFFHVYVAFGGFNIARKFSHPVVSRHISKPVRFSVGITGNGRCPAVHGLIQH